MSRDLPISRDKVSPTARVGLLGELISLVIRFQKFILVGAVGFAVNMSGLFVLTDWAGLFYVASSFLAIELSLFVTFILNERWTWADRRVGSIVTRFWKYQAINGIGIGINVAVLFVLTQYGGFHYIFSNFWGAAVAAIWNFGANHRLTWFAPLKP
jgi:dolichol-phosphate mannosyltransferase